MSKLLSRINLLSKQKLEIVKVVLDDGDYVFVREMSGRDRDRWESTILKKVTKGKEVTMEQNLEDFRAKLAVSTVCDEKGVLLLSEENIPVLSQNMSARNLQTIVEVAQRINKITEDEKEDLVKNSGAGVTGNSSSDSVKN